MKGRQHLCSCNFLINSDSEEKMGDELTLLLEVFHKIEKAGGQATLSASTAGGKSKFKLEVATSAAICHLCLLQPRRHLGVAIVAVVLERGPAAISGLLPTRLHWLR